jgi:hypothetical protein
LIDSLETKSPETYRSSGCAADAPESKARYVAGHIMRFVVALSLASGPTIRWSQFILGVMSEPSCSVSRFHFVQRFVVSDRDVTMMLYFTM